MAILFNVVAPSAGLANGYGLVRTTGAFLANTSDWTVSYWLRILQRPAYQHVYSILGDPTASVNGGWVHIGGQPVANPLTDLRVAAGNVSGASVTSASVQTNLVPQPWNHVALVYAHATGIFSLYVNGSLVTNAYSLDLSATTFSQERLGFDAFQSEANIAMAYYRSWQAALTASQLKAEMAATSAVTIVGLFADTPLTDPSLTGLEDVSGNNRGWTASGPVLQTAGPQIGAAATNLSPTTAYVLASLPVTCCQNVSTAQTNTVWYAYTAQATDVTISLWAFGDTAVYVPTMTVYRGLQNALTNVPLISSGSVANNCILQIYVVPGSTYYIRVVAPNPAARPATLKLTVLSAANLNPPVGTSLVMSGGGTSLMFMLNTGVPQKFLGPFLLDGPGHVLPNGTLLISGGDPVDGVGLFIFTSGYVKQYGPLLFAFPYPSVSAISSDRSATFYIAGYVYDGIGPVANVTTVSAVTGLQGPTTWRPTTAAHGVLASIAVSLDGTTLYYIGPATIGLSTVVNYWTLASNTGGTFVTEPVGYKFPYHINAQPAVMVLADTTVLVAYVKADNSQSLVVRYSAAGAIINTYTFTTFLVAGMTQAANDPASFWVAGVDLTDTLNTFQNVTVATGAITSSCSVVTFEGGCSQEALRSNPYALFGPASPMDSTGEFWALVVNPLAYLTIPAQWQLHRLDVKNTVEQTA